MQQIENLSNCMLAGIPRREKVETDLSANNKCILCGLQTGQAYGTLANPDRPNPCHYESRVELVRVIYQRAQELTRDRNANQKPIGTVGST